MDKNTGKDNRITDRHTWIEDRDQHEQIGKTRLVEKQRKPYSGFITDEQIEEGKEAIRIDDRRTRIAEISPELRQTRVYSGFGTELGDTPAEQPAVRKSKVYVLDDSKRKRLLAIVAVFILLVVFELSFVMMKISAGRLPEKTAAAKAETAQLQIENNKLKEEAAEIGEYDQVKDNKESWERLRNRLTE